MNDESTEPTGLDRIHNAWNENLIQASSLLQTLIDGLDDDHADLSISLRVAWKLLSDAYDDIDRGLVESKRAGLGMQWWDHIGEQERAHWLGKAGSARPVDAWKAFQDSAPQEGDEPAPAAEPPAAEPQDNSCETAVVLQGLHALGDLLVLHREGEDILLDGTINGIGNLIVSQAREAQRLTGTAQGPRAA